MRAPASLLTLLLITACAEYPFRQQQKAPVVESEVAGPPAPSSLSIDQALTQKQKGNWAHAIKMLEEAQRNYPFNRDVDDALAELRTSWIEEKRLLEDRMLVIELTAVRSKMPLLDKLANGEPENDLYQSRRLFWRQYLRSRVNPLVGCGLYHRERDLWLSRKCFRLADSIAPSDRTSQLLQQVSEQIEQQDQATIDRKQQLADRRRERQLEELLQEAEKDMDRGAYGNALVKLDEASRQSPEDPRVKAMASEAQSTLSRQVESLVELGDRLYREEQIGPAVAVWETALELDPEQQGLKDKIDRASRVLEKLESIRSRSPDTK